MTNLATDFLNYQYETSVPSFVICSDKYVLHRPTMRLLDWDALAEQMLDADYVADTTELGAADDWLLETTGIQNGGADPATYNDATATVGGVPGTSATITIGGAGDDGANAATLTVETFTVGGNPIIGLADVPIAAGDSPEDIALKVTAMLEGLHDEGTTVIVVSSVIGDTITLTENGGASISALVVNIT